MRIGLLWSTLRLPVAPVALARGPPSPRSLPPPFAYVMALLEDRILPLSSWEIFLYPLFPPSVLLLVSRPWPFLPHLPTKSQSISRLVLVCPAFSVYSNGQFFPMAIDGSSLTVSYDARGRGLATLQEEGLVFYNRPNDFGRARPAE